MFLQVQTNVAACAIKSHRNYDLFNVEYASAHDRAFLAASNGHAISIVATQGEDGFGLIRKENIAKQRGWVELETNEGRFPRTEAVIPRYDPDKVRTIRLNARYLDSIRRAINGQDGDLTLILPEDDTLPVGVVGEMGIGLITHEGGKGDELGKFRKYADDYTNTVMVARPA